jgi:4-hydroxy-3-polyprenylbenzoate decarboxylase
VADYTTGPYDDVRSYLDALEATGNLVRIKEMDGDAFETTAFTYALIEKYGKGKAPAFVVERVKIDGEWVEGPLVGNMYGPWASEALAFGVEEITDDHEEMFRQAMAKVGAKLGRGIPKIDAVEVERDAAPVKEVVLTGDEIDLTKFAFIQSNPADAGRYITTASVFLHDETLGKNVGTYRLQIKDGRTIGVNPEPGQDGWQILMAKKRRGEKVARCSIVLGQDPILFGASAGKLGGPFAEETAIAGGLRGKPVEVVKSETNEHLVPAHAEMVIEGEIPLDEMLPEGPFGELYGYLGGFKEQNFFMNVTSVTHRPKPIIANAYTGITRGSVTSPIEAAALSRFRMVIPGLKQLHTSVQSLGIHYMSIKKTSPGQGLAAGNIFAAGYLPAKVVVVVDDDIDVYSTDQILNAIGSRWQPAPAATIHEQIQGFFLDPSVPTRGLSSKIVIDATRQLPAEGGPAAWPAANRQLLMDGAPESFDLVKARWNEYFAD